MNIKNLKNLKYGNALNSKQGFTLAEVLITLGVIGIVAAITMPTIIQNYKKIETASRLKKFYSVMTQAIKMSEIDNNEVISWSKNNEIFIDGQSDIGSDYNSSKEFFNKYLAAYLKYAGTSNDNTRNYTIYLTDGSSFAMHNGTCMDFIYDVNGDRNPNINGRDQFNFTLCFNYELNKDNCGNENLNFCPINIVWGTYASTHTTRQNLLDLCKNYSISCLNLIMYDGWEIKDDYPYKL